MNKNYDDFTLLECTTKIKCEKDGYYAFEDTVFYGEKGGMLADQGTINGLKVLDLKWEGDELYHKVDGILNDPITMKVDKEIRYINTSVQSVLHILDGYYATLGLYLPSVGVNPDNQWFEVNTKDISAEDLLKTQEFVNDVIRQDISMSVSYVAGKDYPDEFYQKFETLRLVTFGEINTQPCGTLHVNKTSEIESFQIIDHEKTSKGTRVYFTCNHVTNQKLVENYGLVTECAKVCSVKKEELLDKVSELVANSKALKKEVNDLKKELIEYKAEKLLNNQDNIIEYMSEDANEIRQLAQVLSNKVSGTKVIVSTNGNMINFAIVSNENKARELLEALKEYFTINGGGNGKIVTAKSEVDFDQFMSKLNDLLN